MKHYRLTPAAQQDLSSIWDFTHEHWDDNQAEISLSELGVWRDAETSSERSSSKTPFTGWLAIYSWVCLIALP